jgi:hypothetical protein
MTNEERKMISSILWPGKKGRDPKYNLCRFIDKRRPKHIPKERWETYTYTSRFGIIRTDAVKELKQKEMKALRAQQQALFDRLKKEAEERGSKPEASDS